MAADSWAGSMLKAPLLPASCNSVTAPQRRVRGFESARPAHRELGVQITAPPAAQELEIVIQPARQAPGQQGGSAGTRMA